jgi:spore germination protein GerM
VDADTVPYRLLETGAPSSMVSPDDEAPGRIPVVYWLAGDRLVPEATSGSCAQAPDVLVEELADALRSGPSETTRAAGRATAIPPDTSLEIVGLDDGVVSVDFDTGTSISAERLPAAVGQVVLTLASAPGVDSVAVVSGGEPVQVPLPGGVLTDRPVTADDYSELVAQRYRGDGRPGCTRG